MHFRTYCVGNQLKGIDFILRKVEKTPNAGGLTLRHDAAHDSLRVDFRSVPSDFAHLLRPVKQSTSSSSRARKSRQGSLDLPITAFYPSLKQMPLPDDDTDSLHDPSLDLAADEACKQVDENSLDAPETAIAAILACLDFHDDFSQDFEL